MSRHMVSSPGATPYLSGDNLNYRAPTTVGYPVAARGRSGALEGEFTCMLSLMTGQEASR